MVQIGDVRTVRLPANLTYRFKGEWINQSDKSHCQIIIRTLLGYAIRKKLFAKMPNVSIATIA